MRRKKNARRLRQVNSNEVTIEKKIKLSKGIGKAIHNEIEYHMKEIRGLRLFSLIVVIMLIITLGIAVYFYNLSRYVTEQFCLHEIYPKGYVKSYNSQVSIIGPDGGSIECHYGYYPHGGLD